MRWKGGLIFCFSASVNLVMSGFAENRLLRRIDINLARSPKSGGPIQIIYLATAQRLALDKLSPPKKIKIKEGLNRCHFQPILANIQSCRLTPLPIHDISILRTKQRLWAAACQGWQRLAANLEHDSYGKPIEEAAERVEAWAST